ncbi:MAG: alpha/beta hydrolase, partial [Pseudomonadota bacterium]|nr:alpha/beta hydrolase [Pseudomonadota bacterium]
MSTISRQFEVDGEKIAYWTLGDEAAERQIIWAHGWGQDHRAFEQLAESWATGAFNILIDFPGFGASPRPRVDWGTAEYADACAVLLKQFPRCERIWVGHSFGCRVGIQLAARHGNLIDGL